MKVRNAAYNEQGTIDMEIEHPALGWINFTATPHDAEGYGRKLFDEFSTKLGPYLKKSKDEPS